MPWIYVALVALTYGTLGVAWGTVAGYLAATVYLLVREYVANPFSGRLKAGDP